MVRRDKVKKLARRVCIKLDSGRFVDAVTKTRFVELILEAVFESGLDLVERQPEKRVSGQVKMKKFKRAG